MKSANIKYLILLILFLSSCGGDYSSHVRSGERNGNYPGHYKIGKPYSIEGKKYFPRQYNKYDEVGVASWYGKKFHGKKTANGEIYNMRHLTAAHNTLPLPSIVQVTNLENGRQITVRVNDRGPFAKNRVIDLSKKSAKLLGFHNKGTTKVRVELLKDETKQLLSELRLR